MEYFCGRGFITTDGYTWQHSRKLLKPAFSKQNLVDLSTLSIEVDSFLKQIPSDGATVDIQPLLYSMVCSTKAFCQEAYLPSTIVSQLFPAFSLGN